MDELFESITWRQLELHDRPIGLLNVNGYYDPLLAMNTRMVEHGFVHQRHADLLVASADVASLFDTLSAASSDAPSQLPGRT
jgi:predicted Rossmann-fold nucleotide-binding protein